MRQVLQKTALVAALWAAPLHAQEVSLSPDQVRALAVATLREGDPRRAAALAQALLERIPGDPVALIIQAEAALALGGASAAVSLGRKAFFNSVTDAQRYRASRLVALAHAQQEQDTRAQFWLRAAREFAPNEAAAARVARDFRAVRARNPLSVELRFGVTPSTNINSGSANSETELFGVRDILGNAVNFQLDEEAQALSGWEYAASANLRYRLRTDESSATFLDFGLSGQTYTLTEGSRDRLDEDDSSLKGSDFSYATLSFGVTHRFVLAPESNATEVSLSFAQSWRAGERNRRFVTAAANHRWTVTDTSSFTLAGFSQRQERLENGDQAQVFDISGTYRMRVEDVGSFSFGIGLRDNRAEDSAEDYDAIRYRFSYAPEDPFYGVNFGFNLAYEERDFDFVALVGGSRNDDITTVGVRATFSDIEYFGFRPVLTADRTWQESNSNLFDREYTSFGFDIVSSF